MRTSRIVLRATGRLWRRPQGRGRRPSRREAGKRRLDLFEITLAIGHICASKKEIDRGGGRDRAPRYLIEKTRWPMNHRRCRECARRGEAANSFTTVRVATRKRTMMGKRKADGGGRREGTWTKRCETIKLRRIIFWTKIWILINILLTFLPIHTFKKYEFIE